jgi:nitroreductase
VREYTPATIDKTTIRALIDAAIWAPTAVDRQAWSFVVVTDRDILKRCSDAAKAHLLANLAANAHIAELRDHLTSPAFNIFYGAPALIVVCATDPDPMAAQSVCLAAENLMLAACAQGLGTCWIGFAEAWLGQATAKAELKIPPGHFPVAPIIVGHPVRMPEPPLRRPPQIIWIEG